MNARLAAAVLGLLLLLTVAPTATAQFAVTGFDGTVTTETGQVATQAGSHPYEASTRIDFAKFTDPFGLVAPFEDVRDVGVEIPPGLVGNPTVVTQCTGPELADDRAGFVSGNCPDDSMVGVAQFTTTLLSLTEAPIFSMVPAPGAPASFGFRVGPARIYLDVRVRPGDHGLTVDVRNISQAAPLTMSGARLWGVPADPSHDAERTEFGVSPSSTPPLPFLTNPTSCTAPGVGLETKLSVRSWRGSTDSASFVSHDVAPNEDRQVGPSGCERLSFDPSVDIAATATAADSPTGLDVDLAFDDSGIDDPDGLASAQLRRARVTLPEGTSINPAAADGLAACSDAQLGLGTDAPLDCPAASKIGTAVATSPLLGKFSDGGVERDDRGDPILEQITGGVYIRSQNSSDPTSGEMFRLALVLENEQRGILVKLPGEVRADPATGRLVTTFDNNPQLPVSNVRLSLKSGPRAPLATPPTCGEKTIDTQLTSWAGQTANFTDTFTIPCPANTTFAPGFDAGTVSPTGGSFSPFAAQIDRPERQQFLSDVRVDMPEGLLAKLKGVQLCPDAVAGDGTSGSCPAGSRIGTATVGAGSGNPFFLRGDVYLTGPYKGGPYGLSVQVPAKAGPFDLGTVKVRQALHVDPTTAQVSVVSDPLPQIVKGVPVRLRSVSVDVDRPGFTINPTSCVAKSVDATLTSVDGAVYRTGSRFQASDCKALGFKPRLALRLSGPKQRRTGGHPSLRAVLAQAKGQANIRRAEVRLPKSIALDPENANGLCEYEEGLKVRGGAVGCPASSVIGRATVYTPVLNKPLTGKVYFVKHKQRNKRGNLISKLPSLLVALRGEVDIDLRAQSAVIDGRLVNTFQSVPDAPVSKFDLRLKGGKGGILTVTRSARRKFDVCKGRHVAAIETDGHNGKHADYSVALKGPCGKAAKSKTR